MSTFKWTDLIAKIFLLLEKLIHNKIIFVS